MNKLNRSYQEYIWDRMVTFTYLGANDIPAFDQVTSASVLAFTADGQLVAVNTKKRGVDIPGGHVEPHEKDPLDTLKREIMEEAYMTIHEPELVEVIESDFYADKKSYMLIYGALVGQMHTFVPTDEISERLIISPAEFIKLYKGSDKLFLKEIIQDAWQNLGTKHNK